MRLIEIKNLNFKYPGAAKNALSGVCMDVEEGSFVVLCGKSGCGKSTLLRHLKSVFAPTGERSGSVLYAGREIGELSLREQSESIGYVLQSPEDQIVTDKVWHELAFGLESLGYDTSVIRLRVAEMASYFGIQDWFDRGVAELSGGQKQLLNLASVMAMHPELLILDEPTSQLDPIAAADFLETVRKINRDIGVTVILTEHRLEDVIPWADKVYVMDEGRVTAGGSPADIGRILKDEGHDMFLAMPAPMRIYAGARGSGECPLTVSRGRRWLDGEMREAGAKRAVPRPAEQIDGPAAEKTAWQTPERSADMDIYAPTGSSEESEKDVPAIRLRDVWFRYERDLPDVIRGLSMDIMRGEIFALTGGNGTGKSTAMNLIARVLRPYRGKIWLDGREIRKYTDDELYHGFLGVMPQDPKSMFVKKTVRADLYEIIDGTKERKSDAYPIDMKKEDAVRGIAALTKLGDLLDRHPYDLSGGEQQRLALAKVLLLRPRILLMDEPTKGIDNYYKRELGGILRTLTRHGVTILMISHDVEFCAEYADRTGLFFRGGMVTCGESRDFLAGNNFYTTAANRMARAWFPRAVTADDVIEEIRAAKMARDKVETAAGEADKAAAGIGETAKGEKRDVKR